jgi:hypothetical protein
MSRLQPGFSAPVGEAGHLCKIWLEMVETFVQKPAEAGSNFGVWALPPTS